MFIPPLLLADALLLLHVLVVLGNILPVPLILLGAWRGWRFVRARWFRLGHLALMGFVAVQAWLGQTCPLTIWEHELRVAGGGSGYGDQTFLAYWSQKLMYFEAPAWVFVAAYSGWVTLIIVLFWLVPLRPRESTSAPSKNR
jgi:hypothetical protein